MSVLAMLILALGMSMDAFAAALARGAGLPAHVQWRQIILTALVFGGVEFCTPLLGFAMGSLASDVIRDLDHWVAFVLLAGLGARMIYEGAWGDDEAAETVSVRGKQGMWLLLMTAIGTSIDSMIVGVGLAFLDSNIWLSAMMIGVATTLMAALGLSLGRYLGMQIGKSAEVVGGLVLMGIGVWVLLSHLGMIGVPV